VLPAATDLTPACTKRVSMVGLAKSASRTRACRHVAAALPSIPGTPEHVDAMQVPDLAQAPRGAQNALSAD
jgi:hypothetical protein